MRTILGAALALFCSQVFAQQATIRFQTSFVEDAGSIKALNGVQGGPLSTNSHDADLTAHYKAAGVSLVRFPHGDGFNDGFKFEPNDPKEGAPVAKTLSKLSLSDIFPDREADPNSESSYDFTDLDKYVLAIRKSGAEPLWQAIYDIGKGGTGWLDNGMQEGKSPLEAMKWNSVMLNVLRHMNNGWAKGGRWDVKYVEFMHDPAGSGGYDFRFEDRNVRMGRLSDTKPGRVQFMNDFVEFIRTVEKYNAGYGGNVKVVGPGLDAEQTIKFIPEIMNRLGALKINPEILVFAYRDYNNPQKMSENASFIRKEIDRMVLGEYRGIQLWNVGWNWSFFYPPLQGRKNVTANDVSAWIMAHNLQCKTAVQPYWDFAVVNRASRGAMNAALPQPPDSFYFNLDGKGEPKPAYFGWMAMEKISRETPVRLHVKGGTKDNLLTVLAAKSSNGRKLHILVTYWKETPDGAPSVLRYSVDVANFYQKEGSRGKFYSIGRNSKAFQPEKDIVPGKGRDGSLAISEDITMWSAQLFEFER